MDWNEWLEEPLLWGYNTWIPRFKIIKHFVKDGLIPFFLENGYIFKTKPDDLCSRIATGLFNNQEKSILDSDWNFAHENTDYIIEELDHYYCVMDIDKWNMLWLQWSDWQDISEEEFRGMDRRADIQEYCWKQLDLERSPQTRRILDIVGIYDDQEGMKSLQQQRNRDHQAKLDDIYLKEAVESGQYDGYRR